MSRKALFFSLVLLFLVQTANAITPIFLKDSLDEIEITSADFELFVDTSLTAQLEDILTHPKHYSFERPSEPYSYIKI